MSAINWAPWRWRGWCVRAQFVVGDPKPSDAYSVEELKRELLTVIKKYFPADEEGEFDVKVEQQGERMVLIANLPVKAS